MTHPYSAIKLILAFYLIFLSYDNPLTPDDVDDSATNPMSTPIESIMAMFLMSMTNFGDYYGAFEKTEHEILAKVKFLDCQPTSTKIRFPYNYGISHCLSVSFCYVHGYRFHLTYKHVDCHDG